MPYGSGTPCKYHGYPNMEPCAQCALQENMALRVIQDFEAIRSERDRYRSALAEMSEELSHYPEGDGIFGHLKRILRRALTKTTNPAISIQTGI